MTIFKYLVHFLILELKFSFSIQNCLVLQSSNTFGGSRSGECFDFQVADIKEIIVHTKSNFVGFTFKFNNQTIKSFLENSSCFFNNFTIDFSSIDLIGVNVYLGKGVEGIQFQYYNSTSNISQISEMMGQSTGCFYYLNSSNLNINYLKIISIQGCVDDKGSNYFPFLSFSYSFSKCSLYRLPQTLNITTAGISKIYNYNFE